MMTGRLPFDEEINRQLKDNGYYAKTVTRPGAKAEIITREIARLPQVQGYLEYHNLRNANEVGSKLYRSLNAQGQQHGTCVTISTDGKVKYETYRNGAFVDDNIKPDFIFNFERRMKNAQNGRYQSSSASMHPKQTLFGKARRYLNNLISVTLPAGSRPKPLYPQKRLQR